MSKLKKENYFLAYKLTICVFILGLTCEANAYECDIENKKNTNEGVSFAYTKHKSEKYCIGRLDEPTAGIDELQIMGFTRGPTKLLDQGSISLILNSKHSFPKKYDNQYFKLESATKDNTLFKIDGGISPNEELKIHMDSFFSNDEYKISSDNLIFLAKTQLNGARVYTPITQKHLTPSLDYFAHFKLPNKEVEKLKYKVEYLDLGETQDWRDFTSGGGFPNDIISTKLTINNFGLVIMTVEMEFTQFDEKRSSQFILLL